MYGESRVRLDGLTGTLSVRLGKPGTLQYECRSLDNRREPRTISLWAEGRSLVLRAPEGAEEERVLLDLVIPPSLLAEVETNDSRVAATGLHGGLEVRGAQIELEARGLIGAIDAEIEGGTVVIVEAQADVEIRGKGLDARITRTHEFLTVTITESELRIEEAIGGVEIDLEQTTLLLNSAKQPVEASAREGSLDVRHLTRGGEFRLSESPLSIAESNGDIRVDTDAAVEFRNLLSGLRVKTYRSPITGSSVRGPLEIDAGDASIKIQSMGGPVRINGDGLEIRLEQLKSDLSLIAASSNAVITDAAGKIDVQSDYGDLIIRRAAQGAKVESTQGRVEITELSGPLQLTADGPGVEVSWAAFTAQDNSRVENQAGDVSVALPPKGGCTVAAEARYGRVESEVPGIIVDTSGNTAAGQLERAKAPKIDIVSGGNVYITRAEEAAAASEAGAD